MGEHDGGRVQLAERTKAPPLNALSVTLREFTSSSENAVGGSYKQKPALRAGLGAAATAVMGPTGLAIQGLLGNRAVQDMIAALPGAAADAALAQFEQTNLTALQETETALTQYAKALEQRAALQRAWDEGARAARLSRMRFDAGVDSFLTVLDAERTLANLEAQLAQSQAAVANAQIAVFRALGGGWQSAAAQAD